MTRRSHSRFGPLRPGTRPIYNWDNVRMPYVTSLDSSVLNAGFRRGAGSGGRSISGRSRSALYIGPLA